ncbi:MAG TPA: NAD(P)-dependent oxidoreductase, partial [Balneolaceae bacterium]|nr:NAD(P)-dependent oxidoreductase [Balneolaceae bacterium]
MSTARLTHTDMPQHVLVTEPIIPSVIERLEKHFSVDVGERGIFNDEDALVQAIPEYDGLLSMLSNPVTEKVISSGEKLKIVANHAVGFNNIDLAAARKHNVLAANTPGVLSDSCAEFTIGVMLNVTRHFFDAQKYLLAGKYENWEPLGFLGFELRNHTLGIVGMGRIGQAVAHRAKAFGMNIIYHNRNQVSPEVENALDARYCPTVEELAKKSDVLSLHCPLTDET